MVGAPLFINTIMTYSINQIQFNGRNVVRLYKRQYAFTTAQFVVIVNVIVWIVNHQPKGDYRSNSLNQTIVPSLRPALTLETEWRFGIAVTVLVASTKLLYVERG